uniref:Uncharacterized protein n=1 Tax=Arundo donax TaxID=35708 RepID=A0A0A8ZTC4_ARUDO
MQDDSESFQQCHDSLGLGPICMPNRRQLQAHMSDIDLYVQRGNLWCTFRGANYQIQIESCQTIF